jgi:hypothetical protein
MPGVHHEATDITFTLRGCFRFAIAGRPGATAVEIRATFL